MTGDGEGQGEGGRDKEGDIEGKLGGRRDGNDSSWASKITPGMLVLFGVFALLCLFVSV